MNIKNTYDILIIGGGISSSVFLSRVLKTRYKGKIALVEAGRGLGGRASTRISKRYKGWQLNHGSPNLNICNSKNNKLVKNFIDELLKNNLIEFDNSELITLKKSNKFDPLKISEFTAGNNFISTSSMRKLSENIIMFNNISNQIDYYFETFIVELHFKQNQWILISKNRDIFKTKFLICSSNLLLHKRSLTILNTDEIPLRKAIPKNEDKKIDLLLNTLNQQSYIPRLTFLVYTNPNFNFKDSYTKKFRYFNLTKDLECKFKFERIIFQLQKNSKLGIVLHSKSKDFIDDYLVNGNEFKYKQLVISRFNEIFKYSSQINQLFGDEDISMMRWRASQPFDSPVPLNLQYCEKYKIGFCGDWFDVDGFGRIEGAILSALELANKFNLLN